VSPALRQWFNVVNGLERPTAHPTAIPPIGHLLCKFIDAEREGRNSSLASYVLALPLSVLGWVGSLPSSSILSVSIVVCHSPAADGGLQFLRVSCSPSLSSLSAGL